jgi:hypothetical protein
MATAPDAIEKRGFWSRIAPALTLLFMAPMLAEVLPGATRLSSIFVFPIEMLVWGGGALMIRELVRRGKLGWANMLLLALGLAVAEEWVIQQTSLAPLVIQIMHVEWARAGGVNYVYFLWALVYESVLVVLLPVMLVELLFPARREARWLSRGGWWVAGTLFAVGSVLAWYTWTRLARVYGFHLPVYNPPLSQIGEGALMVAALCLIALGPVRRAVARIGGWRIAPVHPLLPALCGAAWGAVWYAFMLLAFGIAPRFSSAAAMAIGSGVSMVMLIVAPGFAAHPAWNDRYRAWLIAGTMIGTMAVFFSGGFSPVGKGAADFWFKAATDAVAAILFVTLVVKVSRRPAA